MLGAKRLGLLHELVPAAGTFGLLVNSNNPNAEGLIKDLQAAGPPWGSRLSSCARARNARLTRNSLASTNNRLLRSSLLRTHFFDSQRDHIVELVARQAIPAIYERREAATAGGLMSYGANVADAYHQAGIYTGRILKGEKPADLPVVQPQARVCH